MIRTFYIILFSLFYLTGCWSNQEIDNTVLVHGVGLDKSDEQLNLSVEIIKPGEQSGQQMEGQGGGEHIVLEQNADTILEGARELIRYAKRRLDFGHARVWIIGEEMAKGDFVYALDTIRRDQMVRLNSHLFITQEDPSEILRVPTLYEDLVSTELVSALDQTKFIAEFAPVRLREFYMSTAGTIPNGYIPMISIKKEGEQMITSIEGTAVIRNKKMVGRLDTTETIGLNWLLNRVKGGSVTTSHEENKKVSLEISKAKTKTKPQLNGQQLRVNIETKVEGTLADNLNTDHINEQFFEKIEKEIAKKIKSDIRSTINKLQRELKTDITDIGHTTYQTYPKQWQNIRSEWNNIFANAKIAVDVDVNFTHEGLIKESVQRDHRKPNNNPYRFSK